MLSVGVSSLFIGASAESPVVIEPTCSAVGGTLRTLDATDGEIGDFF